MLLSILCCDTRAPLAQFVRASDQNSGSNPGWISILFCNNSSTSSQLFWQGLISFYMKASGEEAFGSAAALESTDMVYTQFRELGVLMRRGFTVDDVMDQCFSTKWEQGKGRQMPVHYGSKEHNFQTVSSCVGNQMPQGMYILGVVSDSNGQSLLLTVTGYAYGLKLSGSKNCVCTYFGDGSAQTGDSHAAMNFAPTLGCPVVFFW